MSSLTDRAPDGLSNSRNDSHTRDEIKYRAYEIWLEKGMPVGEDRSHWLQAEAELQTTAAFESEGCSIRTQTRVVYNDTPAPMCRDHTRQYLEARQQE